MGVELSSVPDGHEMPLLSQEEAAQLAKNTHYRPEELHRLHHRFYHDMIALSPASSEAPQQGVGFPLFCSCASFVGVRSPILQEMFFATFDRNRDGIITFDEFAAALSTMSRGTSREKINLAFDMFHCVNAYPQPVAPNSRTLLRSGMCAVLQALDSTFGSPIAYRDDQQVQRQKQKQQQCGTLLTAAEMADELFASSDEVTREEFAAYALRCPAIVKGLAIC
ncbi:hypothetical protein DQ04_12221010 [Trypanosoma grayi]|uniref:hypothetical protein n=1 Tax=Trypanosoma grayi TaxID=71804 RepID=UPI0004F4A683|nr:hypothetical protein DQ04_12221010 [Trypanosoma grayi]KEG06795.1 hypothetical protein DQ04_12221010 [Trypanosoma grayi]